MLLDISLIDIGDRIREEPGDDFKQLVESVKRLGLLQPILVRSNGDGSHMLIAGERRLRAVALLHGRGDTVGRPGSVFHCPPLTVRADIEGALSEELKLMMEFEENFRRKDWTVWERTKYIRRFHETFTARAKAAGNEWTQEMTAVALRIDHSTISSYLIAEEMAEKHPEVAKAKSMRGAIKRIKAVKERESRLAAAKADESAALKKAGDIYFNEDGIAWLERSVPSESCDLVNLDPPWGDEASYKTKQAAVEEFDDSLEYAAEHIPLFLDQVFRVLRPDRFCIFWYRQWAYKEMMELALSKGFSLKHSKTPCIWYKPDKVSDKMAFPEKQLITAYETFFLLRKGDPIFYEKEVQNVFVESRDPLTELIHQTQKPVQLMERLVRLLTTPAELVIDPCAGSASTLVAGYKAFRKVKGCELGKETYKLSLMRLAEAMK